MIFGDKIDENWKWVIINSHSINESIFKKYFDSKLHQNSIMIFTFVQLTEKLKKSDCLRLSSILKILLIKQAKSVNNKLYNVYEKNHMEPNWMKKYQYFELIKQRKHVLTVCELTRCVTFLIGKWDVWYKNKRIKSNSNDLSSYRL